MTAKHTPAPTRRALLGAGAGTTFLGGLGCRTAPSAPDAGTQQARDELDERLADLTDQSGRYVAIQAHERSPRLERLRAQLEANGLDALLVEAGATLTYLSGMSWGRSERLFAMVALADGSFLWIAPAFEVPRVEQRLADAQAPTGTIVAWDEHEHAYAPLAAALKQRGVRRLGIEPETRYFVAERLAQAFGRERVVSGAAVVHALRGRKDARELELLRAANELTQKAIAAVAERLEAGISDHDLGRMLRRAQERLGLRGVWVLPLLGESGAYPHGSPAGRRLVRGESILVDTGGSLHGYQSDNTRTWVFDAAPSVEFAHAWNTVRDAQKRAFETLVPGKRCRDVDRAAREHISAAGYGDGYTSFGHRLGHGIGLRVHEEPYLDGGSDVLLEPGMTFSDEPGIYLAGRFGIRLEDIVVVTQDGADHFGQWQASPLRPQG